MSICTTIASRFRNDAYGIRPFYPFFSSKDKTIRTRCTFNCIEFDAIKIRTDILRFPMKLILLPQRFFFPFFWETHGCNVNVRKI